MLLILCCLYRNNYKKEIEILKLVFSSSWPSHIINAIANLIIKPIAAS